ncbi:BlaI/MecI/CopY family transcriptional regulator [Anaerolentibacter hominis]|uniref:BlaI/MecI/CopY family transcriptional regulator n=1 Tax=Anaerolentibacter hominis TaxID=3079009 RepID=UPI0031B88358
MSDLKLAVVESHFADIIWNNEPISSGQLAILCERELCWKRTTTYTVLKKLCERGIFQNRDGVVSSLLTRDEFYGIQGEKLVEQAFDGSLPAFIAAFTKRKALTQEEIEEIRHMIDSAGEV